MTIENFCRAQNIHGITNITILMIEQDMPKETGHKQIQITKIRRSEPANTENCFGNVELRLN